MVDRFSDIILSSFRADSPLCRILTKCVKIPRNLGNLPRFLKFPRLLQKKHSHFPSFLPMQTLNTLPDRRKLETSKPLFPPLRLSVHASVGHTSAFHPINSSRCLNPLIKVAPYVLGVDPWGPGCSRT